jgi:nucleoside-diphosphate-sugar epimerase
LKYLVTGGTGFLGRYIVNNLQRTGNEVYIATRYTKEPNHIRADFENNIFELRTNSGVKQGQGLFDYVIHAAGKAHMVPKTAQEKQAFFDVNAAGTKLLLDKLEALPAMPKGLVFISSVAVYGLEEGIEIDENQALAATDPYGRSKIEAEKLILDWGKKNSVTIGIARLPLVGGKNAPGNLDSMIKGIKSGRYFRIGKGDARKSMVWAADVAAILPVLAQKGGIYNFTDGRHPSFAELEDAITLSLKLKPVKKLPYIVAKFAAVAGTLAEKMTGKKMPINNRLIQKITSQLTFSDERAKRALGWAPSPVLDHIKDMVS